MALQALAGFAEKFSDPKKLSLDASVTAGKFNHKFDKVTKANSVILQSVKVNKWLLFLYFIFFSV